VDRQAELAQTSGNTDRFVTSAGRRLVEQLRATAVYPGETVPFWKGISGEKGVDCGRGGARAAASGPALAQEAQTEFSDQQLESFVVAAIAVDEVIREWNPRIQAAENEEQAAQLREEANAALLETIAQTEGMTVEQYQEIGQALQNDPELANRVNEIYREKTGQ